MGIFKKKHNLGKQEGIRIAISIAEDLLRRKDFNDLTPRMAIAILVILLKRHLEKE